MQLDHALLPSHADTLADSEGNDLNVRAVLQRFLPLPRLAARHLGWTARSNTGTLQRHALIPLCNQTAVL